MLLTARKAQSKLMETKQIHLDKSGKMIDPKDVGDIAAESNSEEALEMDTI